MTDLKLKAQSCDFRDLKNSMICDQIVYGIQDKRIRERLLRDAKLTLEEAERLCHASELAQQHAKTFNEVKATAIHDSANVAVVKNKTRKFTPQKKNKEDLAAYSCKRCGSRHEPRQCPAFGKRCSKCNGKKTFCKTMLIKRQAQVSEAS